ncbi:unnamed protein product [Amoebophrya sp. A120]|nr:unnamed protein product [Amoebophrya sp. A120]|eukprot:GSA120T00003157001.1
MASSSSSSTAPPPAAPVVADAKSIAAAMTTGAKDFDDAGSVPLVKDFHREQILLAMCKAEILQMKELLKDDDEKGLSTSSTAALDKHVKQLALACVRTRKYDDARIPKLMREFTDLLQEMKQWKKEDVIASISKNRVKEGFRLLPRRDKHGRAVMNTRLRYHEPREVSTQTTIRALTLMLYNALLGAPFDEDKREAEAEKTQLNGVCVFHDFRNLTLSNVDPGVGRGLIKLFSGRFPLRLGAVYMLEPPFFIRYIVLPMMRLLLPKKLSSRITTVSKLADLKQYFDEAELPTEYGGGCEDMDVDKMWKGFTDVYHPGYIYTPSPRNTNDAVAGAGSLPDSAAAPAKVQKGVSDYYKKGVAVDGTRV